MIRQQWKDLYFGAVRWLALPNHYLAYLRFARPRREEGHYLHLGSGDDYIQETINIDGNLRRKRDLWLDLRNGLPFREGSAHLVYCSHTLEHLYPDDALRLLGEIRRCLKKDGIARIAVPSMEHALEIAGGRGRSVFPREFEEGLAQAVNYLFCDGQHRYGYSLGLLKEFGARAGFQEVLDYSGEHGVSPKEYGIVTLGNEPEGSLVVEMIP